MRNFFANFFRGLLNRLKKENMSKSENETFDPLYGTSSL